MGSQTNRSLQVKHERSKVQRVALAHAEITKAPMLLVKTRDRAVLAAALAAHTERLARRERLLQHI